MLNQSIACGRQQAYRLVAAIDPHQEESLGDEQADAEVLVDGVPVALEAAEEAEGEEADEEADQRQEDAHPRDHVQEHVVDGIIVLQEETVTKHKKSGGLVIWGDLAARSEPQEADLRRELVRGNQSKSAPCGLVLDAQQRERRQTFGAAAGAGETCTPGKPSEHNKVDKFLCG